MEGLPQEWFNSLPPVTRLYVVASGALSLTEYLGYLKINDILLSPNSEWNFARLRRIPLNLIYNGKLSVDFLTRLYFFSRYSIWLETSVNSARNYLWMLLILVLIINIYSTCVTNISFIGPILKEVLLYIWTKKNDDVELMFLFFTVKGDWIPWISIVCDTAVMDHFDTKMLPLKLAGIIIGHIYWFIDSEIPLLHNCKSPFTPIWDWYLQNGDDLQQENQLIVPENVELDHMNALDNPNEEINDINDLNEIDSLDEQHMQTTDNQVPEELDEHEINEFLGNSDYQNETNQTLHHRNDTQTGDSNTDNDTINL